MNAIQKQKLLAPFWRAQRTVSSAILLLGIAVVPVFSQGPPGDQPPAPVEGAKVEEGAFVQPIRLTGSVEPLRRTTLATELEGFLEQLMADEGDPVAEGQALGRVRIRPLELELERARADEAAAQAAYDELKSGFRVEDVRIDEAELAQAQAELRKAERDLERADRLFSTGAIGEEAFDEAQRAVSTAQARLQARQAELDRSRAGYRDEEVKQAEATLSARKAEVALLQDRLQRATVRAPFDGVITRKLTEEGAWLGEGDPVFEIVQIDPVRVRLNVPDKYFSQMKVGNPVTNLTLDPYPNETFEGTVSQVIPQADERSRAFPVRIDVANGEGRIVPGMIARVTLDPATAAERSVVVPRDAIVAQGPMPVVFRINPGDSGFEVERLEVEAGRFFGGSVEVFGDLRPGDVVVIRGNERLQGGAKVDLLTPGLQPPPAPQVVPGGGDSKDPQKQAAMAP